MKFLIPKTFYSSQQNTTTIKKLKYLAGKRGMKEVEILLSEFINKEAENLNHDDPNVLFEFLNEPDPLILNCLIGKENVPQKYIDFPIIKKLINYWFKKGPIKFK